MSRICPACGRERIREIRKVPYTIKDQTILVEQPGEWCACGEGVLTPEDVRSTEKILQDLLFTG